MKILLVEDDIRLGKMIQYMLEKEGYEISWAREGGVAMEYAMDTHYDLIILDWMIPVENGLSVCKYLRANRYDGGILMLTAKDATDDRVLGLNAGADDYLVKPFEFKELLARLKAISRRSMGKWSLFDDILIVADIEIDRKSKTVKRAEHDLKLTVREFQLLDLLAQNYGHVLSREIILDRIWGLENEVSQNNLDAFMRLLRKKIEIPGQEQVIHNVRGIGFKLEARHAQSIT